MYMFLDCLAAYSFALLCLGFCVCVCVGGGLAEYPVSGSKLM